MEKKETTPILGNGEDLKEFCDYLTPHDRKTVERYYRIAGKKKSLLVIRRPHTRELQMQLVVVPYHLADAKGGILKGISGRVFHYTGWIRALPVTARTVFVFAEILAKNESGEIEGVLPKRKKRKKHEIEAVKIGGTD